MKRNLLTLTTLGRFGILSSVLATKSALGQTATLITTFTNPAPAANDYFGGAVAAVGNDRVLIGADEDDAVT